VASGPVSIDTLRAFVEPPPKVSIKLVGITEERVQCSLVFDIAKHVFIGHEPQLKALGAFSAITNMSTGISLDFAGSLDWPLESRRSFPRFMLRWY
jgi:hypothetical protein